MDRRKGPSRYWSWGRECEEGERIQKRQARRRYTVDIRRHTRRRYPVYRMPSTCSFLLLCSLLLAPGLSHSDAGRRYKDGDRGSEKEVPCELGSGREPEQRGRREANNLGR